MTYTLVIAGGTVVDDGRTIASDVAIASSVIDALASPGSARANETLDATDCFVLPGFIDLQLNGGFGVDFTAEPERLSEVAERLPALGVTSFLPTVITSSPATTARAVDVLAKQPQTDGGARSLGVHLEGPFLNASRRGAHPSEHLRPPDEQEAAGWSRESGVTMVTLAPELDGALDVIADLVSRGVVVCAGHTAATSDELAKAVDSGVTGATHLYNAMGSMSARAPGTTGPLLAHPSLICGVIVDGIHVDPVMVEVAWRSLGPRQIALVSDAIAALGLPHGSYSIGTTSVSVDETGCRTTSGVLAGSVLRMDDAVRNLMSFTRCSIADASMSASSTPARLLGREDLGRVEPGRAADIVLVDGQANVVATVIAGRVVHDPQHRLGR
jgi:N-acetylglucosamine-6-phosphate deacetylase